MSPLPSAPPRIECAIVVPAWVATPRSMRRIDYPQPAGSVERLEGDEDGKEASRSNPSGQSEVEQKIAEGQRSEAKAASGGRKRSADAAAAAAVQPAEATAGGKISDKAYAREMKKLHVELVKLQQWVVHKGLKVCIIFEGRDGAGKGGTIKAITERVSPRVFRVVALPAPTEREKSQMYAQRYLPHLPAAGEVVIFDRSWYNRAGVERVMGFCSEEQATQFLNMVPLFEKADGRVRHHPAQVLARGEPGRADPAAQGAHRRRPQDLEALADGPEVLRPLGRLHEGARRDVRRHRHRTRRRGSWPARRTRSACA